MLAEASANGVIYSLIDAEVIGDSFIELSDVQSPKDCAVSCLATSSCMGYSLDSTSQQCKLHLSNAQLRSNTAESNVTSYLLLDIIDSTPYIDLAVGKNYQRW